MVKKCGFDLFINLINLIFISLLLLIIPLFLNLLSFAIVPIIVYASCAFVYLPFTLLFASLYSNYVFDKFLNKNDYLEIYDKGIYRPKRIKDKRKNGLVGPNFAFGRNGAI